MKTVQKGFTLIELIVVIVILGILAATALPKFLSVANDARISVIRGVQGSMTASNSMIYGKAAIYGVLGAGGTLTAGQLGSSAAVPVRFGYAASAAGLATTLQIDTSVNGDFTVSGAGGPNGSIQHKKAPTPANCAVNYTAAANATTPPVYTVVTGGC